MDKKRLMRDLRDTLWQLYHAETYEMIRLALLEAIWALTNAIERNRNEHDSRRND